MGSDPSTLFADYLIVCRRAVSDKPELFAANMKDAKGKAERHGEGIWLQIPDYERFETNLERLIGRGDRA